MQPQVFISYSWKDKDIADTLDKDWDAVGLKLIRDVRDLAYKQNIKDFMTRVNESDYVLLLISRGYLESKNCMYEALEMFEKPSFKEKILPILTEDARIDKPGERLRYIQYWEEEIDKLNENIKKLKSHANAIGIYQELDHYTKIRASIDRFMHEINSILCIPWKDAKQSAYKSIFEVMGFDSEGVIEECIRVIQLTDTEDKKIALDELSSKHPNNIHVLFTKAGEAEDDKMYRKARQHYEKAITLYPADSAIHYNLAVLLATHFQEHQKAKQHYERALEIEPNNLMARINLSVLLTRHFQEYQEARQHLERALEIDITSAAVHSNIGLLLAEHFQEYQEARRHLERVVEIEPGDVPAYVLLSSLLARHFQEYQLARQFLERALMIEPDDVPARAHLSVLLAEHFQEYQEARRHLEKIVEIEPDNDLGHYNLAFLLAEHFKEHEEAKQHYRSACGFNPDLKSHERDQFFGIK